MSIHIKRHTFADAKKLLDERGITPKRDDMVDYLHDMGLKHYWTNDEGFTICRILSGNVVKGENIKVESKGVALKSVRDKYSLNVATEVSLIRAIANYLREADIENALYPCVFEYRLSSEDVAGISLDLFDSIRIKKISGIVPLKVLMSGRADGSVHVVVHAHIIDFISATFVSTIKARTVTWNDETRV